MTTREIDRTTAEHETACVVDVLELETERAALESLLSEAGYTEGTLVERVARLLTTIDGVAR
jgi:hypothetical protein